MTATETVTLASIYDTLRKLAENDDVTNGIGSTLHDLADALDKIEDGLEDALDVSYHNGFDEGCSGVPEKVTPCGVEDVRNYDGGYDVFVATVEGPDVFVGSYGHRYDALVRVDEIRKVMGL